MSRYTITAHITGKSVSDDFARPSLVYSHAQSIGNGDISEPLAAATESTRVLYPRGQRATASLHGARIDPRETRSLSNRRPLVPPNPSRKTSDTSSRPTRVAKVVSRESPQRASRAEADATHVTRYSTRGQNVERLVDERHHVEKEQKRTADSAARYRAEKAEVSNFACVMLTSEY